MAGNSNPLARLRARSRVIDRILAVNERAGAVGGGRSSSAIALMSFLSLFPLLVVGIAVLGWFSAEDVTFAGDAVEYFGLEGDAEDTILDAIHSAERHREATTIIGFLGLAWSGLAVAGAIEAAVNAAWQVKGRGLRGKPRAVAWLATAGLLLLASTLAAHLVNRLPGPAVVPIAALSVLVDALLVLTMFRMLTNTGLGWRPHLPGAVAGGVGLTVLKLISGLYVPRLVESSSLYGSIGVVLALLAWFLLFARLVVYAAALNVVTYEKRQGTVTVELEVPRVQGLVPLEANRGGAVTTVAEG